MIDEMCVLITFKLHLEFLSHWTVVLSCKKYEVTYVSNLAYIVENQVLLYKQVSSCFIENMQK